jgi:hypothetical protein
VYFWCDVLNTRLLGWEERLSGVLLMLFEGRAQALTCTQQAQVCARKAKENGNPQNAVKCLSATRLSACRKTCTYTGNDGRQWPANGDCNAR